MWISTKDTFPQDGFRVLAYTEYWKEIHIYTRRGNDWYYEDCVVEDLEFYPTYWMPLPPPPEDE